MLRGGPNRSGLMSRVTPCEGPRLLFARLWAAATAVEYSRGMTLRRCALNAGIFLALASTAAPAAGAVRAVAAAPAAVPAAGVHAVAAAPAAVPAAGVRAVAAAPAAGPAL